MTHVVTQLQLLLYSVAAFVFLQKTGLYPAEVSSTNLDFDWTYRRAAPALIAWSGRMLARARASAERVAGAALASAGGWLRSLYVPPGMLGEPWPTGPAAFWAALFLTAWLVVSYL